MTKTVYTQDFLNEIKATKQYSKSELGELKNQRKYSTAVVKHRFVDRMLRKQSFLSFLKTKPLNTEILKYMINNGVYTGCMLNMESATKILKSINFYANIKNIYKYA